MFGEVQWGDIKDTNADIDSNVRRERRGETEWPTYGQKTLEMPEFGQGPSDMSTPKPTVLQDVAGTSENDAFMRQFLITQQEMLSQMQAQLTSLRMEMSTRAKRSSTISQDIPEDILPEYDPDAEDGLAVEDWLRRIAEIALAYEWPDGLTLARAVRRLRGAARLWYNAAVESVATWGQFKVSIRRAFPDEIDITRVHARLASMKQKAGESVKTFAYEIVAIAKRARIPEAAVIRYILRGLRGDVGRAVSVLPHATVEDLLATISRYESVEEITMRDTTGTIVRAMNVAPSAYSESARDNSMYNRSRNLGDRIPGKCYKCNAVGHIRRDCPKNVMSGATAPAASAQVASVTKSECEPSVMKYMRRAKINGHYVSAQVDTGACTCLIRESVAKRIALPVVLAGSEFVGFGAANRVQSIAVACTTVEVDGVMAKDVEIHVVPDDAQAVEMLLGPTFTDRPEIRIGSEFRFGYAKSDPYKKWRDSLATTGASEPFEGVAREAVSAEEKTEMTTEEPRIPLQTLVFVPAKQDEIAENVPIYEDEVDVVINSDQTLANIPEEENNQVHNEDTEHKGVQDMLYVGEEITEKQRCEPIQRHEKVFGISLKELGCTNLLRADTEEIPGSTPVSRKPCKSSLRERPKMRALDELEEFPSSREQETLEEIRAELITGPALTLFDTEVYTKLHTDASGDGPMGMLKQQGSNGRMRLVQCLSRKTTGAERDYHASRLELMAVVWGLERLRNLVLGRHVVVITNCQYFLYLNTNRAKNPQIAWWSTLLPDYNLKMKHRSGGRIRHVDALSRTPLEGASDTWDGIKGRLVVKVLRQPSTNRKKTWSKLATWTLVPSGWTSVVYMLPLLSDKQTLLLNVNSDTTDIVNVWS